jgi:hypothetical protein
MRPALYWVVKRSDGEYAAKYSGRLTSNRDCAERFATRSEARAFITSCRPFGDSLRVVRVVSKNAVDDTLSCKVCGHWMGRSRVNMATMIVRCGKCRTEHQIRLVRER